MYMYYGTRYFSAKMTGLQLLSRRISVKKYRPVIEMQIHVYESCITVALNMKIRNLLRPSCKYFMLDLLPSFLPTMVYLCNLYVELKCLMNGCFSVPSTVVWVVVSLAYIRHLENYLHQATHSLAFIERYLAKQTVEGACVVGTIQSSTRIGYYPNPLVTWNNV